MKNVFITAGILAFVVSIASLDASAQGRGGGNGGGNGGGMGSFQRSDTHGLNRADQAAGIHGTQGRANARTRGANAKAFCPPGQRKKAGSGSRFRC